MQQQAWMAYSCSAYFSDQISYTKHFNPRYGLEDMNLARFCKTKKKNKKTEKGEGRTSSGPREAMVSRLLRVGDGYTEREMGQGPVDAGSDSTSKEQKVGLN